MLNPGNTCYVNSTLQALSVVVEADDSSAEFRPLLRSCTNQEQESRPLGSLMADSKMQGNS